MELENVAIKSIATVIRGPRFSERDKKVVDENTIQGKIVNWPNLMKMCDGENINISPTSVNVIRKYKRDEIYVREQDIAIPVFPKENGKNIVYIENEMKDNYIYSELIFILRIKENSPISSEFLYMLLSSDYYSKLLLDLSKNENAIRYRLTNEILENITIPLLGKSEMDKLLDEYTTIQNLKEKLKITNEKFNTKINDLIKQK